MAQGAAQVDDGEQGRHAGGPLLARQAEPDILRHGQVREERVVLEDHPDPALLGTHPDTSASATGVRSSSMVPASGTSKPAIRRRRVVFPQPDGPSSATNSPRSTRRFVDGPDRAEALRHAVATDHPARHL